MWGNPHTVSATTSNLSLRLSPVLLLLSASVFSSTEIPLVSLRIYHSAPHASFPVFNLLHIHYVSQSPPPLISVTLTLKYLTLFLENLDPSARFVPSFFSGVSMNLLQPPLTTPQIIYIRFVLCRLRSHADEGLWRLKRSPGSCSVICRNLFAFIRCTSPFIFQFRLKPPLKLCLDRIH